MKTLLIMAGGTGGHVMPALAVADELRTRGVHIVWMGTANGIEHELVPKAGFELRLVNVKGIRRSGLLRLISAPFLLLASAFQAMGIIVSSRANAVLGMGGYVSGPGGVVSRLLLRPLVVHEQNAVAGTTNRLLAPIANRVLTGFAEVKGLRRGEHIGNPVRAEIAAIEPPSTRLERDVSLFRILVVGGSQGALVFNQNLPDMLAGLEKQLGADIQLRVVHQCGRGRQADVEQQYLEAGLQATVHEFIDDMADSYREADVVICRAGAMTVAEIAAAGAIALFVPYPSAIDDHQYYNAQALAEHGASFCYRQDQFLSGEWLDKFQTLAQQRSSLIEMGGKARSLARQDATRRAADICMEVLDA